MLNELISPTSDGPGLVCVMLSRTALIQLIDLLKDAIGDYRVIRNILIRDLKLCIMTDLEVIKKSGGHPRVQEYADLLYKLEELEADK